MVLLGALGAGLVAWGLKHVVRLVENAFEVEPICDVTADDMRRVSEDLASR